jgi:hypothetical protein
MADGRPRPCKRCGDHLSQHGRVHPGVSERGHAGDRLRRRQFGYPLKAGQLTYDCRYSTMHGMPVTGGRGFRGLKPLWYNGVPP